MARIEAATEVLVIGGGPAGLATAIAARQKGFSVTVADGAEPPIEKACGEGLLPETLLMLRRLGVDFAAGEGYSFRGIQFVQKNARVCANFPSGQGLGLRRPVLHERLVKRAEECGVRLLWKTPVVGLEADGVRVPAGKIHARWILGADGQGSRVRRWSGLDRTRHSKHRFATRRHYGLEPWSQYMEIHWGQRGQAYITPIAEKEVCVVMMSKKPEHAAFDQALEEMPELKEKLAGAKLSSRERGAITMMRSLAHVQSGRVALVGDASGGVDAITGEGLRLAFEQAFALVDALQDGDLPRYEADHREIVRRPMLMGNLLLWLGASPRLRSQVIRALGQKPELFARLLAAHVGQGTTGELLATGALLGMRLLAAS